MDKSSTEMLASERVSLLDGEVVTIRGICPEDAPRLQEGFAKLSSSSKFFRFFTFIDRLPDEWMTRFVNVDGRTQMVLVAVCEEDDKERVVGVAPYAVDPLTSPDQAEFAVVVLDDYQGRGLGTILLKRLAAFATNHGVQTFFAIVQSENYRMMKFLHQSGYRIRWLEPSEGQRHLAIKLGEAYTSG